ncbi:helix-turn-helix domain-containing protein [Rhodococcus spongiicola]|uniref:DNA-binding protein n=1 Tax=Rhodococcus spongiicola TaxID=2487352 RepID=A0A438B5M8_9NOCA|nr:helix-turn-helix domain-containing protein [Rhodococcus spongiicola]RVW06253.1 DNA-binding protein [Rhodococcus spongiicola]
MTTIIPTRLYKATEAGKLLGVHASTVREWWNEGRLAYIAGIGRGRKVSDAQIAEFIAAHEESDA